jgi:hypothetical protein
MTGRRHLIAPIVVLLAMLSFAPGAHAAFGLNEFKVSFQNEDGSVATLAGSHPYAMTTSFQFNTRATPEEERPLVPDQEAKSLRFDLPVGLAGNPTAVPRCPSAAFAEADSENRNACPDGTALGIAKVSTSYVTGGPPERSPVYNLVPSAGVTAKIGFIIHRTPITVDLGVNGEAPNNIRAALLNVPQVIYLYAASLEIWGNPANPTHDDYRGHCLSTKAGPNGELLSLGECKASIPEKPFLTLPRSCQGPLTTTYEAISWQEPTAPPVTGSTQSPGMTGCEALGFSPEISASASNSGEASSGLDFDLDVNDPRLSEPAGVSDSDIERAVVTLPEGFTTNPSVANGLEACTLAQYRSEQVDSDQGTGCPEASKVGSVEIESPLLEKGEGGEGLEILHGDLYVAKQHDNAFDNLLTIYMVVKDPALGIMIKQAGKVEPDQQTGRLTTTFGEIPQLPFSHFHLHFREGQRAPLITPAVCGNYELQADLFPYARGGAPVHRTANLSVSTNCASSATILKNQPGFAAGTTNPTAGAFSPFVLNLTRPDGSQRFSAISATLPEGLLGQLKGIPYCSDAQIAQAASRSGEMQGALESSAPSCPSASDVGTVTVASGAGNEPLYVSGNAYLAGPYKGAPLSLEIVTPAIAGPFDLGVVAVRTALQLDPFTAQITAESDPIPTILHGLPLDVRSISVDLKRPDFTLNPTSCEPKVISGSSISTLGSVAPLSQYFQASNCASLGFKPKLKLSLKGATKQAGYPALKAVLTYPKKGAYANIARAQVSLPHSEFLEQNNLNLVCKQADLRAGTCPKKAIYGKVKAWTPLLEKPLTGNVYLGVGFGYKLPALVAELNGQIKVLLKGKIDSDKHHGIRNTFEAVPDAPVERFVLELKGGKKYGLLVNSENICKKKQVAGVSFRAQNGRSITLSSKISNSCGKRRKGKGKGHGGKH